VTNIFQVFYFLALANRRLHWEKEKLEKYQDKRFRAVVKYANEFVPFYRRRFKEAGVDVDSIRGVVDLSRLPVIKKDEFKRQDPSEIVSSEYDPSKLKKVKTSGSTGTPFLVHLNQTEDSWRKAIYMRANIFCGQKMRDRWVVLTSPSHFGDTTNLQRKIGVYAQNCVSLFEPTDQKLDQIAAARPDVLDGYSGSLVLLAKEVNRRGLKTIRPRLMFGNAELINLESRRFIETVFSAPYHDQFGCAEIDRSAWQCPERDNYHLDVDSVITEFLDSNGEFVSDGEEGEVTYTSLFNFSMPFIRYAIGDIAVPHGGSCPCGVTLPLMEVVQGRKDSFLMLPNQRLVSPMIFNFAISTFRYYADFDQYLIRQRREDFFEVELKMNRFSVDKKQMTAELESHMKEHLKTGDDVVFQVSFVDEIPLSKTGKLLSVTSDVTTSINR
jgi:phenylacetate-CoA ligase